MRKAIKICPFEGIDSKAVHNRRMKSAIINSAQHATLVNRSNEHPQIGLKKRLQSLADPINSPSNVSLNRLE